MYQGDLLEKAILSTFNLIFVSSITRNTFSSFFFCFFFFSSLLSLLYILCFYYYFFFVAFPPHF